DGDNELRDVTTGFALATAVIAVAVVTMSHTKPGTDTFLEIWDLNRNEASLFMAGVAWDDWKIAAIRGLVLVALLLTVRTRKRMLWLAGASIFLLADLLPVVHKLNPRMPITFFTEPPPVAATLPPNRHDYRIFPEADWYDNKTSRQYSSTGDAVYWLARNGLYPMTTAGQGIALVLERDYDRTTLLPTVDLIDSMWDLWRAGRSDWAELMMSMSNGWYRGTYRDFEEEGLRVKGDFKKAMPIEFKEGPHYPRYYFANEVVRVRDRKDFVQKLKERPPQLPAPRAFIHEPAFTPAAGRVLSASESANHATIEVESAGRAFLVMSVTPHKYWRIFIDGGETRSIITNIGYQGVVVPQGRHTITMHYRNTLIRTGSIISIAATLILLAIAFAARRRSTNT
ncbi:MAG: hypothetical protein ABIO78_02075, partial [Thermoanaerobaculia bacterium]